MSLIDNTCTSEIIPVEYCFYNLFNYSCKGLYKADIKFPPMVTAGCYSGLFYNCTNLVEGPKELPAAVLKNSCYYNMFRGCTKLVSFPSIKATTLDQYCCRYMFASCSSLTNAPDLPVASLKNYCYAYMFSGCSSLKKAPFLPAKSLVANCYYHMFENCSSLNNISVGATSWTGSYANSWVSGVAASGTFTKPTNTNITTGVNGIPSGWTVINT